MLKSLDPDILNHMVGNLVVHMIHQPLSQRRQSYNNRNFFQNSQQSLKIRIARSQD